MATTDCLLQLLNRHDQLCDSFLQPCYCILTVLKGGLLETRKTLKVHHPVLEEKMFLRTMVDLIMGCLPLPRENVIVFHNCLLNPVGGRQDLLVILFGIHLNMTDLGTVGPPLLFRVIHLTGGKGSITPVDLCWVHGGFWNNSPNFYPVGKRWVFFKSTHQSTYWVTLWKNPVGSLRISFKMCPSCAWATCCGFFQKVPIGFISM